jgi:hypothetical protein
MHPSANGRGLASRDWLKAWQTWAAACCILTAILGATALSPFVLARLETWATSGSSPSNRMQRSIADNTTRSSQSHQASPQGRAEGSPQIILPQSSPLNTQSSRGLAAWDALDASNDNIELYRWRQRAEQLDRSLGSGESW